LYKKHTGGARAGCATVLFLSGRAVKSRTLRLQKFLWCLSALHYSSAKSFVDSWSLWKRTSKGGASTKHLGLLYIGKENSFLSLLLREKCCFYDVLEALYSY
jgi:hypothetical protein